MKIDKDIPIPDDVLSKGRVPYKHPMPALEVSDSFLFSEDKSTDAYKKAYSVCKYWKQKYKERDFIIRRVENGIRIWRTK